MSSAAPNAAAQNQFPCKQCGASLEFAPGTESLKCPYCGADTRIASVPQIIAELDFLRFVQGLPDGDGVGLLQRLRQRGVACPAIFIAGNPSPRCRSDVAAAGALLIEKPLMGDVLSDQIRALV